MHKTRPLLVASVALLLALGLFTCAAPPVRTAERRAAAELWVVRIGGVSACCNRVRSPGPLLASGGSRDRPAAVLAGDGELLSVFFGSREEEGEREYPYIYQSKDGPVPTLRLHEGRLELGGSTVGLKLRPDDEAPWQWLDRATEAELRALRAVEVDLPDEGGAPAPMRALRRLADVNPAVGLALLNARTLRHVLPLFRPRTLLLHEELTDDVPALLVKQRSVSTLFVTAAQAVPLDFLSHMPSLRCLVVSNWDAVGGALLPPCPRLRSLILMGDSGPSDLRPIANCKGLEELSLVIQGEGRPTDLAGLADLPNLTRVSLLGCSAPTGLAPVRAMTRLVSFGFPSDVSQQDFAAVLKAHPELRDVALLVQEGVRDLSPLAELPQIEALLLFEDFGDDAAALRKRLEPLRRMRTLRLLLLSEDVFEHHPEELRSLEQALPGCAVAPMRPTCLGSGWILLLVPGVLLSWIVGRRLARRRRAA